MFQLSNNEFENLGPQIVTSSAKALRSQIVTLKESRGHHQKYPPFAFSKFDKEAFMLLERLGLK